MAFVLFLSFLSFLDFSRNKTQNLDVHPFQVTKVSRNGLSVDPSNVMTSHELQTRSKHLVGKLTLYSNSTPARADGFICAGKGQKQI